MNEHHEVMARVGQAPAADLAVALELLAADLEAHWPAADRPAAVATFLARFGRQGPAEDSDV